MNASEVHLKARWTESPRDDQLLRYGRSALFLLRGTEGPDWSETAVVRRRRDAVSIVGRELVPRMLTRPMESIRLFQSSTGIDMIYYPTRLIGVEGALVGTPLDADRVTAASKALRGVEEWLFGDDRQATAEYRGSLLGNYTELAVALPAVDVVPRIRITIP